MIRRAELRDRNRVIQLLAGAREAAGFDDPDAAFNFPFDPAYAASLFMYHLRDVNAVCFVLDDANGVPQGMLMASAFDHPYGPVRVSKDTMWFIDPAHRGRIGAVRLLAAFEQWSRENDCQFSGIVGMGEDPSIKQLLARRGYRVAETTFIKAL